MIANPKPIKWKNNKYLDFIRSKPCVFCVRDGSFPPKRSQAHHLRQFCFTGWAVKPPDSFCVAACGSHHDKDQNKPCKEAWLIQKCVEYLTEWLQDRRL